jgi:hypothetical protein
MDHNGVRSYPAKLFAAKEIKSHFNGKVYADQGEEIEVYKEVNGVCFCQGKTKFPCRIELLSTDKVEPEIVQEQAPTPVIQTKKKVQSSFQPSLF